MAKSIPLLVEVRSLKGMPNELIDVEEIDVLEKLTRGRDPQEFTQALKMAVRRGKLEQVKFWHGLGVPLNSDAYGTNKLLMVAWTAEKNLPKKEIFDFLISVGATVELKDARNMGEEFSRAYRDAPKPSASPIDTQHPHFPSKY